MFHRLHRLFVDRRHLETRLRLALRAGRMAAWEWNLRTGEAWWSPEMYSLHGLEPKAGLPQDYYALVHPDDRETLKADVAKAKSNCAEHLLHYRVLHGDGSVHWLEGTGATLCDAAGEPELMTGVCVNIDARKEQEGHLRFLAQASAELAALSDRQATLQRIARMAVPHFADWCAVDIVAGRELERVAVAHVDEDKVRIAHDLHQRFPPGHDDPGGTWHVARTGEAVLVPVITPQMLDATVHDPEYLAALHSLGLHSYIGAPLAAHGRILGVMSFITADSRRVFTEADLMVAKDLAARAAVAIVNAQLMDTLRRSDTAKDVFLATLAHELRNPLAPIVNTLALLSRVPDPCAQLPRALEVMQRQAGHLTRLLDDLLDLARINSGKIELRRERVDLRDVVHAAVESAQPLVDQRRHSLALELSGGPAVVLGDPVRLTQVVANLLNNAARYTPPEGRLVVGVGHEDGRVQVWVGDTGVGIPADELPRLFQLFAQAPRADRVEQRGLGIGLFLVKGLVEMHGGTVAVASEGAGRGSRFTISLPAAAAGGAHDAVGAAENGEAVGKRILVVDDNADAAETLAGLLGLMGHTAAIAADGASALESFEQHQPDIVLLDIGLPDIDGYAVAQRLRERAGDDVTIIALTGWGQAEDRRRAMEAGFDAHWTKPVDMARLQEL